MSESPKHQNKSALSAAAEQVLAATASDRVALIRELLEKGDNASILEVSSALHPADITELLQQLKSEERRQFIDILRDQFDPEVLTHLEHGLQSEVIEHMGAEDAASAIAQLDTDDAVQVIEELPEDAQQEIMQAVPEETRADLEEGLAYPESSAGRLMQKEFVAIPEFWTIGDTIDYLRENTNLQQDFYVLFVMSPQHHPVGSILLSRVIRSSRDKKIRDLMEEDIRTINTNMDQEEVAHIFRKYGLVEAPVVNDEGRMVGVITVDDVVDVIREEEEEDYLRAGGIIEHNLHASPIEMVKMRFPWLLVNLATAIFASWVIWLFEDTISRWVALAVLMPIVASMGGNAGIQTVTVAVRAITSHELTTSNAISVIRKEMLAGLLNGVVFALIMGTAIWSFYGDAQLAMIFGIATISTLMLAGLAGAIIPVVFHRAGVDPAVASGVFLTMLTDMAGFFAFLGLASWLLQI